jgi:hypothetical protein
MVTASEWGDLPLVNEFLPLGQTIWLANLAKFAEIFLKIIALPWAEFSMAASGIYRHGAHHRFRGRNFVAGADASSCGGQRAI